MNFRFYFVCIVFTLLGAQGVFAASDDITIRTQIGSDTTPPTTPILTNVTPVSDDQIDLVWDPSTDDFSLSGYTIERDGTHLATTTLTTYSDTGLVASTTYSYVIRAFDWITNVSSSSNALATTTLAAPIVPPSATTTSSSTSTTASGKLVVQGDFSVITTATSARLSWQTNRPSRYVVRWGRTLSYELGSIATERYRDAHAASLTDLVPNTTYYYEVVAFGPAAPIAQVLKSGTFKTKPAIVVTVPPNVSRLIAVVNDQDVTLSWQNIGLPDGYTIRVVRSHIGYPADPYDGMVLAQGVMESWRDASALRAYGTQFYSVFVVDAQGNVSSGALVQASRVVGGETATSSVVDSPVVPPDLVLPLLTPHQIVVSQDGVQSNFENEVLVLDPGQPITLSIPVTALPARLKSIIVTLTDPTDSRQAYRFLLRRNQAGDAYETTLAPLQVQGTSLLLIEVYDLEAHMVGRYGRQINFITPAVAAEVVFPDVLYRHWPVVLVLILLLVSGVLVRWYWYGRV